jgi:hypothetical protein
MARTLRLAVAASVIVALAVPTAVNAAPCAPGTSLTPTITVRDQQDPRSDRSLTATHDIVLFAEWPTGGASFADDATASWSGPPGVPMFTQRSPGARALEISSPSAVGFLPAAADPLPVTVTWEQTDNNSGAKCTGSFTTTLQIAAAKPLRPGPPRSGGRVVRSTTEYQWLIAIGRNRDRSPLEVRFRAVRGAHLPGPRVRFKSAKFILRPTDTSASGSTRPRVLQGGSAQLRTELQALEGTEADALSLTFRVLHRSTNPRLGYEIQILQGGRRIARLRAASRCDSFFCPFSTFKFGR